MRSPIYRAAGKIGTGNRQGYVLHVELRQGDNERVELSITGDILRSGQVVGGGQIRGAILDVQNWSPGWNRALAARVVAAWDRWHLNGLRAECEHQRALGWTWATHPSMACPTCGYRLGSAWLYEPLPDDIIVFITSLPGMRRDV